MDGIVNRIALAVLLLALLGVAACGDDQTAQPAVAPTVEVPEWPKIAPDQIAEAEKHGVPVAFENDLGMRFVLIPAGTRTSLMAGMLASWWTEDDPERKVTVAAPFYLQTTDVTRGQCWRYGSTVGGLWSHEPQLQQHDQSVWLVPWEAKVAFAKWMSGEDAHRAYRMPTQAEFEYAAGAGAVMSNHLGFTQTNREAALLGFRLVSPLSAPNSSK